MHLSSMHGQILQEGPGAGLICGMALEPVLGVCSHLAGRSLILGNTTLMQEMGADLAKPAAAASLCRLVPRHAQSQGIAGNE